MSALESMTFIATSSGMTVPNTFSTARGSLTTLALYARVCTSAPLCSQQVYICVLSDQSHMMFLIGTVAGQKCHTCEKAQPWRLLTGRRCSFREGNPLDCDSSTWKCRNGSFVHACVTFHGM